MWRLSAKWAWKSCFSFQNNLKGADWSRHIFVHSATAMALNKIPAMSPSSSGHCSQYDTTYATIGCVLRKAFADDTIFLGVHREPARNRNVGIPGEKPMKSSARCAEIPRNWLFTCGTPTFRFLKSKFQWHVAVVKS